MARQASQMAIFAGEVRDLMVAKGADARNSDGLLKAIMKQLSELSGERAKRGGHKVYSIEEVREAWLVLCEKNEAEGRTIPLPKSVLFGTPPFIEAYQQRIIDDMPPVWDSCAHDQYVGKHYKTLKKYGYRYTWLREEDQFNGSRITFQNAQEMGIV
jgi:hypothetical protein